MEEGLGQRRETWWKKICVLISRLLKGRSRAVKMKSCKSVKI